ncbi:MAG: phosphohydrolase, partial [bacterium]|nr:phosphohydrolase [bacterium]
ADQQTIGHLEAGGNEGDIRILVAHRPDAVLALSPNSRIDLVVAGHTHGGQVVVPLLGPPFTLTRVPRHVAAGGFHDLGGRRIYVSRGVGCERSQAPRIRFLAPPEISLLTLDTADGP